MCIIPNSNLHQVPPHSCNDAWSKICHWKAWHSGSQHLDWHLSRSEAAYLLLVYNQISHWIYTYLEEWTSGNEHRGNDSSLLGGSVQNIGRWGIWICTSIQQELKEHVNQSIHGLKPKASKLTFSMSAFWSTQAFMMALDRSYWLSWSVGAPALSKSWSITALLWLVAVHMMDLCCCVQVPVVTLTPACNNVYQTAAISIWFHATGPLYLTCTHSTLLDDTAYQSSESPSLSTVLIVTLRCSKCRSNVVWPFLAA